MKKPKVEFISMVDGLADIEECRPVPANKMTPTWWKSIKGAEVSNEIGNVKNCPSFPDFLSQGYIIPMWADTIIEYDDELKTYRWSFPSDQFSWEVHPNEQMIDSVSANFLGDNIKMIFKAVSPWRIRTPKGWSVYQLPLFYHYENEFSVFPGIIDTDIHHQINQQVGFTSSSKKIFIKRGTPFVQYIPFKRQKTSAIIYDANPEEKRKLFAKDLFISGVFSPRGMYKKMQKNRDSCPVTGKFKNFIKEK
jgi:hypothetical protein